jgi:hypothetical protein
MMRWFRRLLWLSVLVGVGLGGYQAWSRRRAVASTTPEWPPLRTDTPRPSTDARPEPAKPEAAKPQAVTSKATWMAPVDGKCPDGYPLKANARIFHAPGGRFYDRTAAERCYARAEDAIADGYRPAKA